MGSMHLHSEQRQQGALSPKLQHAVRLLQLSSLDFAQTVQQALGRNPFLEETDSDDIVTADDTEHDDETLDDTDDDALTLPSTETHDDDGASDRDLGWPTPAPASAATTRPTSARSTMSPRGRRWRRTCMRNSARSRCRRATGCWPRSSSNRSTTTAICEARWRVEHPGSVVATGHRRRDGAGVAARAVARPGRRRRARRRRMPAAATAVDRRRAHARSGREHHRRAPRPAGRTRRDGPGAGVELFGRTKRPASASASASSTRAPAGAMAPATRSTWCPMSSCAKCAADGR